MRMKKSEDKFLEWLVSPQINIEDYTVNVTISIEKKKVKMVFEDRGVGISTDDIKELPMYLANQKKKENLLKQCRNFTDHQVLLG